MAYADVHLLESLEVNVLLDGCSHVRCSLVSLLGVLKFLELCVDGVVLNLLEEQGRSAELVSGLEEFGAAELIPFCISHVEHLAELCRTERKERFECYLKVGYELQ